MQVFHSNEHLKHEPPFEDIGGENVRNLESPKRVEKILGALRETGWAEIKEPNDFGLGPISAVHDKDYLDFLASAWTEWRAEFPDRPVVLPGTFVPPAFAKRGDLRAPKCVAGRAGLYLADLGASIVEGTYSAALASANCALSATEAVKEGARSSFALCRPPGHHAGKDFAAGYCYINNAAVAANSLSSAGGKVAVLDIDYHCGNGTQDIFYERPDVLTVSIHIDPDFGYPYYAGYADQIGSGAGIGFHRNFPLPEGTGDSKYLETLESAIRVIRGFKPDSLVVSAGMDIYRKDPLGEMEVTTEGIREIGKRISALSIPTVVVMEGGYDADSLGKNVSGFLEAFR